MKIHALFLSMLVVLALVGCKGPETKTPVVQITAFINVSSGCQQATVDQLQQLAAENQGKVKVVLVDFGDGGEGARRWQESGHSCQTIEINGSPHVKLTTGETEKTVTFQLPEGFMWTHDDLRAAVAAGLEGKLVAISPAEAAGTEPARQVEVEVTTKPPAGPGRPAQVILNGKPVLSLFAEADGKSPDERAKAAAMALKSWLSSPVKVSDLEVKEEAGGWALTAIGKPIAIATEGDGKLAKASAKEIAEVWATATHRAVVNSAKSE